ncbi:WRKY DNA-binding protein 55 [Arabidopsis thaliana]|uniref:WRKY DNA-binding protein 55 n=1 Tax=Arabidopsis thaliana TaxID=3702 RepID=Q4PSR2_ARATH|nr:WRKY DNA-binding protein 55 [Arabidopsis thaliana]AAY78724.1 WRKY family transcription factor [Arabidopsis thaliana]AEC09871.1 WRKY DNA-binding protein 55 [Arabidopsis thaliana]|eukprot:NP_001078033.1 WRKY DNA-binding protein 55 [Arabidopsis thaliana]
MYSYKKISYQMEEVMSMIFHGMKLVKSLESSLPEKPPESLLTSLDEIVKTFSDANERLKMLLEIKNSETALNKTKPVIVSVANQMLMQMEPGLMQEYWLRYGGSTSSQGTEAMFQTQLMAVDGGGERNLTAAVERSGASGSSTPRQRRRAYYRCTHQKLYNCPAKKQVQRLNDDPFTFRVTYRGSHTCYNSTAPTASSATPSTIPISSVTTGHSVDYGLAVVDMADVMFGSGGVGTNMDFIFPKNDPS